MSLWFAVAAFAVSAGSMAELAITPRHAETPAWQTANLVALLCLFGMAPLGHLFGAGFGVLALFRRNERRGFAVAGLLVNGAALVLAAGLLMLAKKALGGAG